MTAGSSALAGGEPDAGYARLQLFVSVASCLLNQVALPSKRYGVRQDPSPLASAKGSRHNYRLYRARSVNPGPIPSAYRGQPWSSSSVVWSESASSFAAVRSTTEAGSQNQSSIA